MRDREGYNKESYVIKDEHMDCTKDMYEIFKNILHLRSIMTENTLCRKITGCILNGIKMVN